MKMKIAHHVTEFLNPTRKKSPDPMTKAAFFTESHSPPLFPFLDEDTIPHHIVWSSTNV